MKLNEELDNLHHWLLANKLTLNIRKTEYMIIGSRQRLAQMTSDPKIPIGPQEISRVSETKTLGILVDENITWNSHIEATCKKISKAIGMMRRVKNVLSTVKVWNVYKRCWCYHILITALWFGIIAQEV